MEDLPLQVVSTGLPYLIVPIKTNLANARIVARDFERLLARFGARFAYILDVLSLEGRTWDNDGRVEDIATGSAAGPAGAFLVAHKLAQPDSPLVIHQGRFLGRSSELTVVVCGESASSVRVSGEVHFIGSGHLNVPDSYLQPMDSASTE
jgi:PhzF family phenazine biosynthesis protein